MVIMPSVDVMFKVMETPFLFSFFNRWAHILGMQWPQLTLTVMGE